MMAVNGQASVYAIEKKRDIALKHLAGLVPYALHLGVSFERHGDELTGLLRFDQKLIGNPSLPALHGGVTGAFLEITAMVELSWQGICTRIDKGGAEAAEIEEGFVPPVPKVIDITVDFLRTGLPRDVYARAYVKRSGRRFASVAVEAWQDSRSRPIAQATAHFLMPTAGND